MTLDIALGGGYPRGRVIEIYGPESSGKTTLALHALAEVQKSGGVAAFIDAEHALDPAYADRLGVDVSELLVSQPDSGTGRCSYRVVGACVSARVPGQVSAVYQVQYHRYRCSSIDQDLG